MIYADRRRIGACARLFKRLRLSVHSLFYKPVASALFKKPHPFVRDWFTDQFVDQYFARIGRRAQIQNALKCFGWLIESHCRDFLDISN